MQFLPLREKEASWGQLVELMPDAIAKVKSFVGKAKKEDSETAEEPTEEESSAS